MRKLVVALMLIAVAAVAAVPAGAEAARFRATLSAPGHHPQANHKWRIRVTATTFGGRKLHAIACYHFLFHGSVVHTQCPTPRHPGTVTTKAFHFYGSFRDPIIWPRRAIGIPLTFQVVVKVRGRGSVRLNYGVNVRK